MPLARIGRKAVEVSAHDQSAGDGLRHVDLAVPGET